MLLALLLWLKLLVEWGQQLLAVGVTATRCRCRPRKGRSWNELLGCYNERMASLDGLGFCSTLLRQKHSFLSVNGSIDTCRQLSPVRVQSAMPSCRVTREDPAALLLRPAAVAFVPDLCRREQQNSVIITIIVNLPLAHRMRQHN